MGNHAQITLFSAPQLVKKQHARGAQIN